MENRRWITSINDVVRLKVFRFVLDIEPFLDEGLRPWKLPKEHRVSKPNTQKGEKKWIRLKRNFGISQTTLLFLECSSLIVSQLHIAILTFTENFELFFNNPFEIFSVLHGMECEWRKWTSTEKPKSYKFEENNPGTGFCLQFKGLFRFRKTRESNEKALVFPSKQREKGSVLRGR